MKRLAWLALALAAAGVFGRGESRAAAPEFPPLSAKSIIKDCGDPKGSPDVCRVRSAPEEAEVRRRLGSDALAWWPEGDHFTIVARHSAKGVRLSGAVNLPMAQLPGSDLWTLTLRIPRLEEAMIDMIVTPTAAPGPLMEWRGPKAPPKPTFHKDLRGRLIQEQLDSRALGGKRGLTVYLPPDFTASRRYPVAYFADGRSVGYWSRMVEPLIASGKLRPIVLVGLHSGSSEARARDYLPGWKGSDAGFEAHERFLLSEVMPRAEAVYGASSRREDRLLIGASNGAAWAVATAVRNPKLFGAAAGVSLGWTEGSQRVDQPGRPRLFLTVGLLEDFLLPTRELVERARLSGEEIVFVPAVSGHGQMIQEAYLDDMLIWAFGGRHAPARTGDGAAGG